ncbi:SIR2 family protein [Roseibium sediminicola]|uniref:SIR2 family protein n=1 Tax=Roseibium sediminicola TaxID=2933272 RepID=A0ABT0GVL0_9HYPH|nr:SIR2 family protein [Roseibium sp. CAU 1639]MCK7613469.1 SIR2 family protein [Roseibium sp. CAU 1639]
MRFFAEGPSIPDTLLERCDAGRVVFLCGAGVSFPSGMPTFLGLTQHVIEFFDPPEDSEVMAAFRPWLNDQSAANVPLDQIFNLLHQEYGKDEVNALVTERLRAPLTGEVFGREHSLIRRISSNQSGVPQIVTTNFDLLFEVGVEGGQLACHVPPTFPDLSYGSTIEGITYLHGRLVDEGSEHHQYVLSSADFGRAYLSEGWATNFIRNLLERYTVVLVGYQAEDPPVKYLLQGLNHDGQFDRSRLFAFDRGLPEQIEAKWRDRGVTAIAYPDHSDLWRTMEAWADRADDPREWRASIITRSQQDPKELTPHERGQVVHVLRTVQGARMFSVADPMPHAEWVCVMDANIRTAKKSRGYGEDAESFDPVVAYGLDSDLAEISEEDRRQGVRNDDLLVWRDGDDNPHEFHRLGGRQSEGHEATPKRLGHLISWVSKSIDCPAVVWWAIRQNGLHPRLLQEIEWQLERSEGLHQRARHLWRLVLEHHRDPRNRHWGSLWFDLRSRIKTEGWNSSVLREFRRFATPRIDLRVPFGLSESKPPSVPWDEVRFRDLGQFEVKFLEQHSHRIEVPDEMLPQVIGLLEEQLTIASGLLADIETFYFHAPTCYPGRQADGREHVTNTAKAMSWFVQLFDRMADLSPELANGSATIWPASDRFFFRKLKLYAFNKPRVFEADNVAEKLCAFDQEAFWDASVTRELLFLLEDRWDEFSQEKQGQLIDRILEGPDQLSHWSNDDFPAIRDGYAARYARYLELQGCILSDGHRERLSRIVEGLPGWNDGWATSSVTARGAIVGAVGTDETPDVVKDLPVNEIVSRAKEDLGREFGSFTERRPFTGLVKTNPRKALSALTVAGRFGDYPESMWSAMINDFPDDVTPRLRRVFLSRLARLPQEVVCELSHTLARWIEQNLETAVDFDADLGWAVYDHVIESLISGGADAAESALVEVQQDGETINQSRRTYDFATAGPFGKCTSALFSAVPGEKQKAGSLVPDHIKSRIERLFSVPGEGADHAVSIACSKLNWLMFVDPDWTRDRIIPMLAFDHMFSEPAWNGFLNCGRVPWPPLAEIVKPLLLGLFPKVESFTWDRDVSEIAAEWLGYMRVFHSDEKAGLSRGEMRAALRAMTDDTRNRLIFWLAQVGKSNEEGWTKHVIPFVDEVWPRERRYRTSASVRAWIGLLDDTGEHLPVVLDAVKKFLVPVETSDHPFYRFTRDVDDEEPITVRFPEATLDLMDTITPKVLTRRPYELPKVLSLVAETEPALTSDPRYLRLIDLVERS